MHFILKIRSVRISVSSPREKAIKMEVPALTESPFLVLETQLPDDEIYNRYRCNLNFKGVGKF